MSLIYEHVDSELSRILKHFPNKDHFEEVVYNRIDKEILLGDKGDESDFHDYLHFWMRDHFPESKDND